jgi:tRNA-binding protein
MTAAKPTVEFDTFAKVDMRVGRIVDVEAFPEARKPAWKLTVDFGPEVGRLRTSAQVTNYKSDELVDRLVVGVVNFGAKRIAGFESQFLVLGSISDDGTVLLLTPEDDVQLGDPIA